MRNLSRNLWISRSIVFKKLIVFASPRMLSPEWKRQTRALSWRMPKNSSIKIPEIVFFKYFFSSHSFARLSQYLFPLWIDVKFRGISKIFSIAMHLQCKHTLAHWVLGEVKFVINLLEWILLKIKEKILCVELENLFWC